MRLNKRETSSEMRLDKKGSLDGESAEKATAETVV